MAIAHAIWTVGKSPQLLQPGLLPSEQLLEDMIVASPSLLADEWMLIGRQEATGHGGRIDLLAIQPDGSLVLIEIKRDRTPRDVVAQALDYAAWVESLDATEISAIYGRFKSAGNLSADFKDRFGRTLDEETLNARHEIVIVASSLDPSSERIVEYLARRDIAINVLCFQVFTLGAEQLLSRAWLIDPVNVPTGAGGPALGGQSEPWNGEFYASFGEGETRSWDDAVKYGFICAGGGRWYSKTLNLLPVDARIWVKSPEHGFIGVGRVLGPPEPAASFRVKTAEGDKPVLEALTSRHYHRQFVNDPEKCEYFVPVKWLDTVPLANAIWEVGLFGNQNTVCQPTTPKWRTTIDRLRQRFPHCDAG
jgi:hypothetical protein